jgi:hypothetical protein
VAYTGQQTDDLLDPDLVNNLWTPVAEDRGAHGIFDQQARFWSAQHMGFHAPGLGSVGRLGSSAVHRMGRKLDEEKLTGVDNEIG